MVVLTGRDDDELAIQAVRSGAQDYLSKHDLAARALNHAVGYAVERARAKERDARCPDVGSFVKAVTARSLETAPTLAASPAAKPAPPPQATERGSRERPFPWKGALAGVVLRRLHRLVDAAGGVLPVVHGVQEGLHTIRPVHPRGAGAQHGAVG